MRLLTLALVACGHAGPLALEPAPSVFDATTEVVRAINAAAAAPLVVIGVDGSTVWVTGSCGSDGLYDHDILVGPCKPDHDSLVIVLTHEIGHALGLRHVADPASVMFATFHPMELNAAAASLVEELHR